MSQPPASPTFDGGTGPEDLILVQRALRAERGAVDELLARLSCVVRFVYRLNRSLGYHMPLDLLEDVVQQVYLAMWPRLADFAGSAALESWAFGFCRNCLRAAARKRAHELRTVDAGEYERPEPSGPEHAALRAEGVDLLRQELGRLQPVEREVVEQRHLQGLSFEQIAHRQGIAASTVKDRCYRALLKMKDRLKDRDVVA